MHIQSGTVSWGTIIIHKVPMCTGYRFTLTHLIPQLNPYPCHPEPVEVVRYISVILIQAHETPLMLFFFYLAN